VSLNQLENLFIGAMCMRNILSKGTLMKNKYLSRAFLIVVMILLLNTYCFIFNKTEFISALTVLDTAVASFVSFGTYFKEKNYKD
jgi:hypothetical protein